MTKECRLNSETKEVYFWSRGLYIPWIQDWKRSKVQVVAEMFRLHTKKGVRTFLGIIGYYRQFVKDYATIAEPLMELTKKNLLEQVKWSN